MSRSCRSRSKSHCAALFVLGERGFDAMRDALLDHLHRFALQLFAALEREAPQRVDHLALLVHHVVVVEQPLTSLEVLQLDALLRLLDRARDQRMREHLAFLRAHGDPSAWRCARTRRAA